MFTSSRAWGHALCGWLMGCVGLLSVDSPTLTTRAATFATTMRSKNALLWERGPTPTCSRLSSTPPALPSPSNDLPSAYCILPMLSVSSKCVGAAVAPCPWPTCCLVLLVVLWALVASLVASLYCNECGASNGADKLMVSCVCLLPVRCFCRACWRQEIEILNEVEAANALRLAFSGSITFAFACALCAASPPTCCDAVRVL